MSAAPRVKAFLLCAGLGTRLRPLTDKTPKCLLPIAGRPLMSYWLDSLAEAGVAEVLVNTHWLAPTVREYLGTRMGLEPQVRVVHEPILLGSAGTIAENADWASDADVVLSLYGDLLSTQSLKNVVAFHGTHSLPFTLSVTRVEEPKRCGIATVDEDGTVTLFVEKPQDPESNLAGAGIYAMDPIIVSEIKALGADCPAPFDLGFDVIPNLAGRMKAYFLDGIVHDIGTHEAYEKAQEIARENCFGKSVR